MLSKNLTDQTKYRGGHTAVTIPVLVEDLKLEWQEHVKQCAELEGNALFRAQGKAQILQELIVTLEHGANSARLPDSRISGCV